MSSTSLFSSKSASLKSSFSSQSPRVPRPAPSRRAHPLGVAAVLLATVSAIAAFCATPANAAYRIAASATAPDSGGLPLAAFLDSLRGESKKLRARFVSRDRLAKLPTLPIDGPLAFITLRPFTDKIRGMIGSYRIGFFPGEQRAVRSPAYANPEGFVEITARNQDTRVSDHFRLRDFITHDQGSVWPKYLVLREPLVDKLELILGELRAMGVSSGTLRIMSGFRTPQYNAKGVGAGGRVEDSRHQYGDAADIYMVNGARDWMTDLDGDGKITTRDARVIALAADRVEQAHPELIGGVGVYAATRAHGPFVHVDVRGTRARWGLM